MNRDVLIRPVITEKSIADASKGKYTFVVHISADKNAIKTMVQDRFSVHVTGISTNIVKGKRGKSGAKRLEVKITPWKKAMVTLKKDEKIDLFDVGGTK